MSSSPLVSFILVTYNQECYIRDAINGALAQDYQNIEIIISDDCSSDKTWVIIQDTIAQYTGNKRVCVNRNEHNLGIREHINKVLYELAKGEIIVLAAGDDVSLPNRTSVSVSFFERHPEVTSLSFASKVVDKDLRPCPQDTVYTLSHGLDSIITLEDYVLYDYFIFSGNSRVLRRKVIDCFPRLAYSDSEDIYLFLRSLYIGSIGYIRQPLVLYRHHDKNESARKWMTDTVFEQMVEKQIWEDFDFAIAHNYIKSFQKSCVSKRLNWVIDQLHIICVGKPRRERSLIFRIAKAIKREIKTSKQERLHG